MSSVFSHRSAEPTAALRMSLANTQAQLDHTRDEIKRLQLENSSLKAKLDVKQSNKRITVTGPFDYTGELRLMANKFTLFDFPWVKYSIFQCPCPLDPVSIEERYLSNESIATHLRFRLSEAATAELKPYLLPTKISEFGNNFVFYCQTQRSNMILRARKTVAHTFATVFPEQPITLWSNEDQRASSEFCQNLYLTKNDESQPGVFKDILAPIIFADCEVKANGIFQNEVLFRIGIVSLFGTGPLEGKKASKKSNGIAWKIKSISAGFIAWTCVAALYLVSNDRSFEEVGPTSGIPYAKAYLTYKERLEIHASSPRFQDLIRKWNKRLFGTDTDGTEEDSIDGCETLDARSAAMNAELFDDPESEYQFESDSYNLNQSVQGMCLSYYIMITTNTYIYGYLKGSSNFVGNDAEEALSSASRNRFPNAASHNESTGSLSIAHLAPSSTLQSMPNPLSSALPILRHGSSTIPAITPASVISLNQNDDSEPESDAENSLPAIGQVLVHHTPHEAPANALSTLRRPSMRLGSPEIHLLNNLTLSDSDAAAVNDMTNDMVTNTPTLEVIQVQKRGGNRGGRARGRARGSSSAASGRGQTAAPPRRTSTRNKS